jgi:hypothetical protein
MNKICISAAILFLLFITTNGQTSNEEINRLRNLLKLPASTALITEPISPQLRSGKNIKVYIATDQDKKVTHRITNWINKWNQEEGSKYAQLRVVASVLDADVILAFRTMRELIPQTRTVLSVGSAISPKRGASRSGKPEISTDTYASIARYTYLITRPIDDYPQDTFQILYAEIDRSHIQDYSDPDKFLFNELKKKIKER